MELSVIEAFFGVRETENFLLMRASSFSSFSAPWPDPNSPVLAKIDFGVPLVELLKWLDVRANLLGQNFRKQDIAAALALARDCKHPDAVWLTSIFEGKEISTPEDAREVFILHQDDARALCFAWYLNDDRFAYMGDDHWIGLQLIRRAAEMGNALACWKLAEQLLERNDQEAFRLAQFAASRLERDAFFGLGYFLERGIGCEANAESAKENILIAAELGSVDAADSYSNMLVESDLMRWLWLSRAALHGLPQWFILSFSQQVYEFFSDSGNNSSAVFLIGRTLKGNIDVENKRIFGRDFRFDSCIGPANQAISFYDSQIRSARFAVDTWAIIANRLHLIKDMRIHIGKMIWEGRFEANYTNQE